MRKKSCTQHFFLGHLYFGGLREIYFGGYLFFNFKSFVCEKIFVLNIFSRRYLFWRFTGKCNFGDLLKNVIFGVLRKTIFLAFYEILTFSSSLFFWRFTNTSKTPKFSNFGVLRFWRFTGSPWATPL